LGGILGFPKKNPGPRDLGGFFPRGKKGYFLGALPNSQKGIFSPKLIQIPKFL